MKKWSPAKAVSSNRPVVCRCQAAILVLLAAQGGDRAGQLRFRHEGAGLRGGEVGAQHGQEKFAELGVGQRAQRARPDGRLPPRVPAPPPYAWPADRSPPDRARTRHADGGGQEILAQRVRLLIPSPLHRVRGPGGPLGEKARSSPPVTGCVRCVQVTPKTDRTSSGSSTSAGGPSATILPRCRT